jgi:hypothetical protein
MDQDKRWRSGAFDTDQRAKLDFSLHINFVAEYSKILPEGLGFFCSEILQGGPWHTGF